MPRIIFCMPPLENCFIIFWVCSNWHEQAVDFLHLCHFPPGGDARSDRLRDALISSGRTHPLPRELSWNGDDSFKAAHLNQPCPRPDEPACCAAWANWAGNLSSKPEMPPILRIWPICSLKSFRSKPLPVFSFWANSFAFS
jgi:hypothetical protein